MQSAQSKKVRKKEKVVSDAWLYCDASPSFKDIVKRDSYLEEKNKILSCRILVFIKLVVLELLTLKNLLI